MKNFKRCCLGLLVILSFFSFSNFIYADTYDYEFQGTTICYNASTGEFGGSFPNTSGQTCQSGYRADAVKKIDGDYAYCVERSLPIESSTYELDSSWGPYWDYAIKAGLMVKEMEYLYGDPYERYAMTGAILNTYFNKERGFSASYDFYSNAKIKSVYDAVNQKMNELEISGYIPAPNLQINGNMMNTLSNFYISNKITLTGLLSSYGGYYNDSQVKYTITATSESGKAEICEDALGRKCAVNKELYSPSSSTYEFYVKVSSTDGTEIVSGSSVEVNALVNNGSWFPTVVKYVNLNHDNNQDLVKLDQVWYGRENDDTIYLSIQNNVNHVITVQKVDERGKFLKGANLEIYRDSYEISSNLLKANQNGASKFSYTSETVSEDEDDFFNHDYYLVEKSAPDGYVLQSQANRFHIKGTSTKKTSICYYNGGAESDESKVEEDSERCNFANYDYMCKASDGSGFKKLNEDGTCNFEVVLPDEDDTGGENGEGGSTDTTTGESGTENGEIATVDETVGEDNTDGGTEDGGTDGSTEDGTGDNTGEDGTENTDDDLDGEEPEVSVVTYEPVCYKKSTGEEVDKTYCDDKANYTKVTLSSGNLTVTQINPKNLIRISKQAVGGDKELTGAVLKICTAADYETKKQECSPAKTVDDIEMTWISGVQPYEFVGVKKGDYYIVETASPNGYISLDTAIAFSIDETGAVKTEDETITYDDFKKNNGAIVIENKLNSFIVSKQDIDTSKELAGATLSICRTYVDGNGEYQLLTDQYSDECIVAMLYNGKRATWKSTEQAKEIKGLKAGTYYLVEKEAPAGYNTTESILFTLKDDGTLVDKNGNVLTDNKIVMQDKLIEEVKTGELSKYTVMIILIVTIGLGISSYCFIKMGKSMNFGGIASVSKPEKIRKRKIRK